MMKKKWCTGNDLINFWSVSDKDIADFMTKGLLKPYYRLGNKAAMDIKYGLPNRNKPLSQIESEVRNNILILKTEEAHVIIGGEINYGVVRQLSKGIIIDEEITQVSRMSSSYRIPTEQEINILSKFLYEAQPDSHYLAVPEVKVMGNYYFSFMSETDRLPSVASRLSFRRDDVNRFAAENCLPLLWPDDEEQPIADEPLKQTLPSEIKPTKAAENYFYHEGGGWRIGFQGEKGTFPNHKYIRCISMLLERQGKEITCLELVHAVEYNALQAVAMSSGELLDESLSQNNIYKDEEVSNNTIRKMEQISSEIQNENDPIIIAELRAEFKKLKDSIERMNILVEKEGRPTGRCKKQLIDDPLRKKAQGTVSKGLGNEYKALRKSGLKKLAKHLEKCIQPAGHYDFQYSDTETHWDLKL